MEYHTVDHQEGNGFTTILDNSEDIEFVNPIEYHHQLYTQYKTYEILDNAPELILNHRDDLINAIQSNWHLFRHHIECTEVPTAFLKLFGTKSKDEQARLLNSQTLTVEQLTALSFKAWDEGFTYSTYIRATYPKNVQREQLPKLAYQLQDGRMHVSGDSSKTDGELRQTINQRKVITSFFLDRGYEWHCIFGTYRSIYQGEKSHKGGQAHFHYLSDKFGLSREVVLERFTQGDYPSTSVHIDLLGYGNQTV